MKRFRWPLVLFLLGASVCVSVVPQVDRPETNFNEADAPVNLAPPLQLRIQVVAPVVDANVVLPVLPVYCAGRVLSTHTPDHATAPSQRHQRSLQHLLCTLLI
ncbi:MAG TPA: hypothetical protein VFE27_13235 [Acidobacteriaceae bacterium]|nr:hypothetical protein [Acidobacteriaceae bacterium]